MTLAVYPLVYLPVAASLRGADPGQEEVARSLGVGRLRTFWRVSVGQARLAILGGSVLVALVVLAEYGAFEILGFRTFTTEIFTEYLTALQHPGRVRPVPGAGGAEHRRADRRGRPAGPGPGRAVGPMARPAGPPAGAWAAAPSRSSGASPCWWPWPSGSRSGPSATGCSSRRAPPCRRRRSARPPGTPPSTALGRPGGHGRRPAGGPALGALAGTLDHGLERSTYLVLAMPGLVIALALTYFSENVADGIGTRAPLVDRGLRHHVLPPGPGGGARLGGPGPGRLRGARPFARPGTAARCCGR